MSGGNKAGRTSVWEAETEFSEVDMLSFFSAKSRLPTADEALPGRATPLATSLAHFVNGRRLAGPYPEGIETAMRALAA